MERILPVEPTPADKTKDKRTYPRYAHESPLNLYRMDDQDQSFYAQMNDYSAGGLSLMTKEKLVLNQLVYLEMNGETPALDDAEKNMGLSGYVKWAANPVGNGGPYTYGIKFSKPVENWS